MMIVMELKRSINSCEPNLTTCHYFVFLSHFHIILIFSSVADILKMRIAVVMTMYDRNLTH